MNTNISLQKVQLIKFPVAKDSTGILHFLERADLLPGGIRRAFWISDVSEDALRGNHAHLHELQILIAVCGKVEVWTHQAGQNKELFILDDRETGLFVPALTWVETRFSAGAILLGFSNREFSESDYIRNLDEFENYQ